MVSLTVSPQKVNEMNEADVTPWLDSRSTKEDASRLISKLLENDPVIQDIAIQGAVPSSQLLFDALQKNSMVDEITLDLGPIEDETSTLIMVKSFVEMLKVNTSIRTLRLPGVSNPGCRIALFEALASSDANRIGVGITRIVILDPDNSSGGTCLNARECECLSRYLDSNQHLTKLEVGLQDAETAAILCLGLVRSSVTTLGLELSSQDMNDPRGNWVHLLGAALQPCCSHNIQCLKLRFHLKTGGSSFKILFSDYLPLFTSVTDMRLEFPLGRVPFVEHLGLGMKRHGGIERLLLQLYTSETDLRELRQGLETVKHLSVHNIDWSQRHARPVNEMSPDHLGSLLSSCTNLERLVIMDRDLSIDQLFVLRQTIKLLPSLKSIEIKSSYAADARHSHDTTLVDIVRENCNIKAANSCALSCYGSCLTSFHCLLNKVNARILLGGRISLSLWPHIISKLGTNQGQGYLRNDAAGADDRQRQIPLQALYHLLRQQPELMMQGTNKGQKSTKRRRLGP